MPTPKWPRGHPDFAKGNSTAVTHGAHTRPLAPARRVEAKAEEIADAVPVRAQDGGLHPSDRHAVAMLADVLVRIELASAHLAEVGMVNRTGRRKGEAHSLLRHISRWEAAARDWMNDLGMTPRARAALGLDLARTRDLAREWAERKRSTAIDTDAEEVE